jgi:hypothetical protein
MTGSNPLGARFALAHPHVRAVFGIEDARGKLNGGWTLWESFRMKHRRAEKMA